MTKSRHELKHPEGGKGNPDQYARFTEAAREHGCEENAERMDEVVRRIAKMPPPRQDEPKLKKGKKA